MRTRHLNLAAALAILALLAIPPSASAVPLVDGFLEGPANQIYITIQNATDPADTLDIVEITLDGTTAISYDLVWTSAGIPLEPDGAMTSFSGEGTSLVTLTISDAAGTTPGFNGGEQLTLAYVNADGVPSQGGGLLVPVADFVDVGVTVVFSDRSDPMAGDQLWSGRFVADAVDPNRLNLTVVPEPGTAALLLLGLAGLSAGARRSR